MRFAEPRAKMYEHWRNFSGNDLTVENKTYCNLTAETWTRGSFLLRDLRTGLTSPSRLHEREELVASLVMVALDNIYARCTILVQD